MRNKHIISLSLLILLWFLNFPLNADQSTQQSSTTMSDKTDNHPWWLGDMLTLIGIIVGARMIIYQLGRQHKNELELQKENYREQLRLKVYQEFSEVLEVTSSKAVSAGICAFMIPVNLNIFRDHVKSGLMPSPVISRASEFNIKHQELQNAIINLIRLIEKYEIVSPELDIFKLSVGVANYDIAKAFEPLHRHLLDILPMDMIDENGNVKIMNIVNPANAQMEHLDKLVSAYKNAQDDLTGYLFDFNVALQNIFLSRLFNNHVKVRQPLDHRVKVISTDPESMIKLRKYFEEDTAWGKDKKQTEKNVRANLMNNP